jgi:hypothetical protein
MISLGGGEFCFSRDFYTEEGFGTELGLYRFTKEQGFFEA